MLPVRLDEAERVHVEVVAGFVARRALGGDELADESAIDPGGFKDRESLGRLGACIAWSRT